MCRIRIFHDFHVFNNVGVMRPTRVFCAQLHMSCPSGLTFLAQLELLQYKTMAPKRKKSECKAVNADGTQCGRVVSATGLCYKHNKTDAVEVRFPLEDAQIAVVIPHRDTCSDCKVNKAEYAGTDCICTSRQLCVNWWQRRRGAATEYLAQAASDALFVFTTRNLRSPGSEVTMPRGNTAPRKFRG